MTDIEVVREAWAEFPDALMEGPPRLDECMARFDAALDSLEAKLAALCDNERVLQGKGRVADANLVTEKARLEAELAQAREDRDSFQRVGIEAIRDHDEARAALREIGLLVSACEPNGLYRHLREPSGLIHDAIESALASTTEEPSES